MRRSFHTVVYGLVLALTISTGGTITASDTDRDGDGLSDFLEVHKYFTDPSKSDSDGDGIDDGDWNERREFAYTIRTVVKVRSPISKDALNDDFQDAKILDEANEVFTLEVIHYPFNKIASGIGENNDWLKENRDHLKPFLDPGPTTNWDRAMRNHMLSELRQTGIDVRRMSDREAVKRVSSWLMKRVNHLNSGCYGIIFVDGKPQVLREAEDGFRAVMWDKNGTIEDQFQRELYGRGMYYQQLTGSCTSAANYLTTCLRAAGIPTRMVRAIPAFDASDPAQVEMIRNQVQHDGVRQTLLDAANYLGKSFAAHTYNEVYVDGRWHRLNYSTLGQNTYGREVMGLLTHVQRYDDLANAGLGEGWGKWLNEPRTEPFLYSNPYRLMEISDGWGEHAQKTD